MVSAVLSIAVFVVGAFAGGAAAWFARGVMRAQELRDMTAK